MFSLNIIYAQESQQIQVIDHTVNELARNLDNLTKIEAFKNDTLGFSYIYSNEEELKAIILQYNDLTTDTRKDVSWYFSNDGLIYSEQKWTNIYTSEILDHQKFYANQMKLVAWNKDGELKNKHSVEFQEMEIGLMKYAQDRVKSFNQKQSTSP